MEFIQDEFEIHVNYVNEMEVDPDCTDVKGNDVFLNIEQEHEEHDQFLYDDTEHEGGSEGITVYTKETETGVTEALGIQDDDDDNDVSQSRKETYETTVTTFPSEGDWGEFSYALFVQQPEDEREEKDDNLIVYDWDEGDDPNIQVDNEQEIKATKSKTTIAVPKKSQTTTQTHMCNYCNYTSPKRYLLSRHMKSHSEDRQHNCRVCNRVFKTLVSFQNHINRHTGTKPHKCKLCESAFATSGELVRHTRYRHTHEKPHHCTECDYSSVELSKLKRHMRCHTGERPYQCPHCTYASSDTFKLKRHLRIHTEEKPYECDICQARFTQTSSLKAHSFIHTGNKPIFKCELCPVTCGRKTDLRVHVQNMHTSEHPLKCKSCCEAFPDRYTFKLHCKTHAREKCFKCDLCPYVSSSKSHLESHKVVHADQKPYQCERCDQAFRHKHLLRGHQNFHHNSNYVPPQPKDKQHECTECGRKFVRRGNLIRHMVIHDPESSAYELAMAIKIGRQKQIQVIDGHDQQVDVIDEKDDEDDENELETQVLTVEAEDGQLYIVLEVIQLRDGEETEQAVAVVFDDESECELLSDRILNTEADIGDLHDHGHSMMHDLHNGESINEG